MMGDKNTILLLKIVNMPISPGLSVFTKKGKAENEITLDKEPVTVYTPICLKESFNRIDFMF